MKAGHTKLLKSSDGLRWAYISVAKGDEYDKNRFLVNTYYQRDTGKVQCVIGNIFPTEKEAVKSAEKHINN